MAAAKKLARQKPELYKWNLSHGHNHPDFLHGHDPDWIHTHDHRGPHTHDHGHAHDHGKGGRKWKGGLARLG